MMQYSMLYNVSFQEDRDITFKINTKGAKTTTRPNINLEALEKNKSAELCIKLCIQREKIPVLHTKIHYHNRALRTKHRLSV